MLFDNVLVTGGTGFVGKNLKKIRPNWVYASSRDYNLVDTAECARMYADIKPTAVIHLAGLVGGIKENNSYPADFLYKNISINTNVLHQAYEAGVTRVLSCLPTCAFPADQKAYPFDEKSLLHGIPEETNLPFAYAKRCLYIQSNSYRKQHGLNYSCFTSSNLYGPEDNFDSEKSHFVAALVEKLGNCNHGDQLEFWGTGKPMRQQLYVDDLVKAIPFLLQHHNTDCPLIVSPDENLSILRMIEIGLKICKKDVKITFNNELEGQHRKDGSNRMFLELVGGYKFTSFEEGFKKTYDWYKRGMRN
ncbi:TPA: NAD-dependent epimerase/dehydratase family protein [Candidatus Woesearchaeota archaeon]|nr:NAD-dependent epimerase/dehydratase family protein [Candidatus Woesearchaeota archaeon]